ncbi:MAG: glycosyltransferase [Pseudomonadota bacterium]
MLVTVIAGISLAAWIALWGWRSAYWRADQRLTRTPAPPAWPAVCAIIPARNEADHIAAVIGAHMASAYPGAFSIVLADDQSGDGTAERARAAAASASKSARRLEIVSVPDLPAGWTGKLWAMENAVARAREISPDAAYYLFTDADIVHAPQTLAALVAKAEYKQLALVSLMARLDARGAWGALLIPAFIYFFQKLYPFRAANSEWRTLAAAAGGCMLIHRETYEETGGVGAIRSSLIDDCALARQIKTAAPIWIGLADGDVVSRRDNRSFSSVWKMVSRTAFTQLDYSWAALAGTVLAMGVIYIVPPLVALTAPFTEYNLAGWLALAAWGLMTLTYAPTARLYGQPFWRWPALPVAGALYTAMTIGSGLAHARGKGGLWKGRRY